MTKISRIRKLIKKGQRRIKQIVTFNQKRRKRIKRLRQQAAPRFGVDFAYGNFTTAELKAAGVTFVCRYLSPEIQKNLSLNEARAYASAGIDVVVVWESTGSRALAGRIAGTVDAHGALKQAHQCRIPAGRPIYFAVDLETSAASVAEYFAGVESVLGRAGTGVYGSYAVCAGLFDRGLVGFGWQTYAWSNGLWERRAQLQQYSNGHVIAGTEVDYDRSVAVDFGQWQPSSSAHS